MQREATSPTNGLGVSDELEPAFLDDEGPSSDIPCHVSTTNSLELYGCLPGRSLDGAIAFAQGEDLERLNEKTP